MVKIPMLIRRALVVSCVAESSIMLLGIAGPKTWTVFTVYALWHFIAQLFVAPIADWLSLNTPIYLAVLFIVQVLFLTPVVYLILRLSGGGKGSS